VIPVEHVTYLAFDCETHLITKSDKAPKLVCGAFFDGQSEYLATPQETIATVRAAIHGGVTLVGHNIAYDFGVLWRAGLDVQDIFRAYSTNHVYDTQIAEQLHAIACGNLGRHPTSGADNYRYSLANLVEYHLNRSDAKANDEYRLRYSELDGIPFDSWPEVARQYPIDDVRNTFEILTYQATYQNQQDHARQAYSAWCLQLGAIHGLQVNQTTLAELVERVEGIYQGEHDRFSANKFLRDDGKVNGALIKRRLVEAYCTDPLSLTPCEGCDGAGYVSPDARLLKSGLPSKAKRKPKGCVVCNTSGYSLDDQQVPRTEADGIATGRDALNETDDPELNAFAAWKESDKIRGTYLPFLQSVQPGQSICLEPNVLLETGRTSYRGVIQQLPRAGGVRECFEAPEGHVFYSVDYTGQELVTHAQSCLNLLGYSKLADALNRGVKVHDLLGSKLAGITYDQAVARKKETLIKGFRTAAKAANFGFPGGMGLAKFVLAKRKEDFTTVTTDGFKYKGIRFCVYMRGVERCGVDKIVTEDRFGNKNPPLCEVCYNCARELKDAWLELFPENKDYFKLIGDHVDKGEIVQHWSNRVRGGVEFCSAANGYFQGLASDISKYALREVTYQQYCNPESVLYGSRNIIFLHDELFGVCRAEIGHEVALTVSKIMVACSRELAPDVLVEAEPALMFRMSKGAEAVYKNERLVPWEQQ
jgi:DNA polymerase I